MTHSLPADPSLENLKKQAKALKKACKAGDAEALRRVRAVRARSDAPRLADCQLVLAREAGCDSWPQLKVAVESARQDLPDQFVSIALLCHDDPHYDHRSFHARAHEMLREHPWLTSANVGSAAAAGNTAAVRAFLDDEPDSVNRPGIYAWTPLICACYSRVEPIDAAHSTYEVAKLLLDRGANPNAFTIKGNSDERLDQTGRRFTALTGVFGGGSTGFANQPPHPKWRELAQLLLERGADPADEEAVYLNPSAALEILIRHGLKPDAPARRKMDGPGTEATVMGRALSGVIHRGDIERVRLLLASGAHTNEKVDGRNPWEQAMSLGHMEIARMLEEAGAPTTELSDVERFVSLCLAGDERGAREMLDRDPGLRARAPGHLVHRAVHTARVEAVKLVLDLGFDPNWVDDNAAIQETGVLAKHEDILRLLLERGASLKLRDPWYDSTGVGWADFFDQRALRDRLLQESDICLLDALEYDRLDRVADILARDTAALERPFARCLTREPKPEDWQTPLVRMVDRGKTEAVHVLLEHGADVTARHPDRRTLLRVARDHGFGEIAELLQQRGARE